MVFGWFLLAEKEMKKRVRDYVASINGKKSN